MQPDTRAGGAWHSPDPPPHRRYSRVVDRTPQRLGLIVVDGAGLVVRVNDVVRTLVDPEVAEGATLAAVGRGGERLAAACERARREGPLQLRLELGQGRVVEATVEPAGTDADVTALLADASAWDALADGARRDRQLVELFFEHAPDIVTILEPDLTQRRAEGSVERLLGYARSEPTDGGLSFVHPDDHPGLEERASALLSGEARWLPPHRYRVRAADGGWRWLESTTSDLRETELGGFLLFTRDVTDHELEIRANAEARARIEALVTGFRDPVLLIDAEGTIVMANDAHLALYDLERADVVGRSEQELWELIRPRFLLPDDFEAGAGAILARETPSLGMELRLVDGRVLEIDHVPVRTGDELVGRVWVTRDVTAARASAEQRQRLLDLEREARSTAQQRVAELSQIDEMRRRLVSTVSHELRTPLTSVISHLQLLLDDVGRLDPDDAAAIVAAERNARRLKRLVDDLLDLQRMERRGAELVLDDVDLAALVDDQVASLRPVSAQHGVSMAHVRAPALPTARLDEGRIRQVVDNLLSNAIRYTPRGGHVGVRTATTGGGLVLEVADDGVGIAREHVGQVFEPFFRAVGDGSPVPGTGLGLSITRAIVEAHGGTIACSSEPAVGSTFTVRLPLTSEERAG